MQHIIISIFNLPLETIVLLFFLVFARIGGCFMVLPAFSSAKIPKQVRLFLAIAFSCSIAPFVKTEFIPLINHIDNGTLLLLIASETMIGVLLGASVQAFFVALQFATNIISLSIGFQAQRTFGIIDSNSGGTLDNLVSVTAMVLFFVSDMHMAVLKGLVNSYFSITPSLAMNPELALHDYKDSLIAALNTLFRIGSPFLIYSILVNFTVGLINKLTPSIPIYFISTPAVMIGGVFLLYIMFPELLNYFSLETLNWITRSM